MGALPIIMVALLGLILLLLLLLLAVPIGVAFRFEGLGAFKGQITVHWLFGCVSYRLQLPDASESARQPQPRLTPQQDTQVPIRAAKRQHHPQRIFAVLRQVAFRQRVYRLVQDLIDAVHLRRLRLRVRAGLGDPADTGRLWALVGPLHAMAQSLPGARVQIEPEFMDAVFEFRAQGRLVLIPLQVVLLVVGFALSPASLRAWRTLKSSHA